MANLWKMVRLIIAIVHIGIAIKLYFTYLVHLKRAEVLFNLLNKIYSDFTGTAEELSEFISHEKNVINKKIFLFNAGFYPKIKKGLEHRSNDYRIIINEYKRERRASIFSIVGVILLLILFGELIDFYEAALP